jgi:hypothetical protein
MGLVYDPRGLPRVTTVRPGVPEVLHELEKQCTDMLHQGIIRHNSSSFSASVLLIRKSDDSWCFCVNYHALNAKIMKDKFPIPIIEELFNELCQAKLFTKLDLRSGYHQV